MTPASAPRPAEPTGPPPGGTDDPAPPRGSGRATPPGGSGRNGPRGPRLTAVPEPGDAGTSAHPKLFSPRTQLLGLLWAVVAIGLTAADSAFLGDRGGFFVHFVVTSQLFSVPAIVLAVVAARRTAGARSTYWWCYAAATFAMGVCGVGIVTHVATGWRAPVVASFLAMIVVVAGHVGGGVVLDVNRAGARAATVDFLDSALVIVAIGAPLVVLRADAAFHSPYAWFAAIASLGAVAFTSNLWCAVVLLARMPRRSAPLVRVSVALAALAVLDSLVVIEHVVSGFGLPSGLVLVLNATAFALLALVPLQSSGTAPRDLGTPVTGHVRTGRVVGAVLAAAVPLTVLATIAADFTRASLVAVTVALALIVGLSTGRQLLAGAENRRLYDAVERADEDRRALLAAVLTAIDDDRRRVALQLHEQAVATYTALASLVPHAGPGGQPLAADTAAGALTARLAARAEALRALILAIRPVGGTGAAGLAPILEAYVDSLGDRPGGPGARVVVDESLELDWITETSMLRVAQEAIRNAHRHAGARRVVISLAADGDVPVLRVADDGVGFDVDAVDPDQTSGITTMRRFADFCGGELHITSAAGKGTVVEARLGAAAPPANPGRRRSLRAVGARPPVKA
jgi:signal transduction histidine kinase